MANASNSAVAGLAGFVLRAWKGRGAVKQERTLRVVESLALGGRKQLHMVSCGGRMFLVGTGADAVQCIMAVDPDAANAVGE